jgi:hypothetical protein
VRRRKIGIRYAVPSIGALGVGDWRLGLNWDEISRSLKEAGGEQGTGQDRITRSHTVYTK